MNPGAASALGASGAPSAQTRAAPHCRGDMGPVYCGPDRGGCRPPRGRHYLWEV